MFFFWKIDKSEKTNTRIFEGPDRIVFLKKRIFEGPWKIKILKKLKNEYSKFSIKNF